MDIQVLQRYPHSLLYAVRAEPEPGAFWKPRGAGRGNGSMQKPPLGKLEPVSLRDYWLRENSEFTPWLSQPENLKLLGDAIGKDLEPCEARLG